MLSIAGGAASSVTALNSLPSLPLILPSLHSREVTLLDSRLSGFIRT